MNRRFGRQFAPDVLWSATLCGVLALLPVGKAFRRQRVAGRLPVAFWKDFLTTEPYLIVLRGTTRLFL